MEIKANEYTTDVTAQHGRLVVEVTAKYASAAACGLAEEHARRAAAREGFDPTTLQEIGDPSALSRRFEFAAGDGANPMPAPFTVEGRMMFETEDGGAALIGTLYADEASPMFVRVQSYEDRIADGQNITNANPELAAFYGRKVRITVEVID